MISEQELLQTLLDHSPDYIFFKDRQSCFLRTNKAHAQLLNLFNPEEAIGKTDFSLFPEREADAQRFYDEEQQIMATGEPVVARVWQVPHAGTGEIVWLSEHKVPIRDESGQVIGLLGIGRDITAQKRAEIKEEKRVFQLKTAADIGYAASRILDPRELIRQSVNLIRERFELYYVGLFLVEKNPITDEEFAYLRGGTGEAGQQMLRDAHRLPLKGKSLVGQCARSGEAYIANDVSQESAHYANALLPETNSEMVLPLVSRGNTIGVLTIQSQHENAFAPADIPVYQIVAGQLASALENARLFHQVEEELEEAKKALRRYVNKSWSDYLSR